MTMDDIIRLLDQQDYDAADRALQARLNADPQDIEAHFVRACLLYTAESYERAAVHIRQALSLIDHANPAAVPLLLQAGDIALMLGQAQAALACFRQSLALDPQNMTAARRLYRELRITGDPRAPALKDGMVQASTQDPETLYGLAGDLAAFEDDDAAALLQTARRQTSDPALLRKIIGEQLGLALLKGQPAEALTHELMSSQETEVQALLEPLPPAPAGDAVTVIVTTNLTKKLIVNRAKAPPQDTLLRETLESFTQVLKPGANTKLVIYYDAPKDLGDPDHPPYLAALEQLAASHGAELRVRQGNGLRRTYIEAVRHCDTPYFMLLEHDWLFDETLPPLAQLTALLAAHPFIHQLRFHKSPTVAARQDHTLRRDSRVAGMPVLRTSSFSNNPHIARTDFLQMRILPLIAPDASLDSFNAGAGGVEETVRTYLDRLEETYGFTLAHRWGGCYVYGQENDPPRLTHTGI